MPSESSPILEPDRNSKPTRLSSRFVLKTHHYQSQKMKLSSHRNLWSALFLSMSSSAPSSAPATWARLSARKRRRSYLRAPVT